MILLKDKEDPRRRILLQALAAGVLGLGFSPRRGETAVLGNVPGPLPAGRSIYDLSGDVKVNGKVATLETKIQPNDTVETGPNGRVVFVVGKDSFMVRGGSKLIVKGQSGLVETLQLLTGKVLSVFGKSKHQVRTPTAVVGIRGTGVYTEADPEVTYFCTCYGVVDLFASNDPNAKETIESRHHDKPRYILAKGSTGQRIQPAGMKNHTDEELMILEALVGRTVPFAFSGQDYVAPRREY